MRSYIPRSAHLDCRRQFSNGAERGIYITKLEEKILWIIEQLSIEKEMEAEKWNDLQSFLELLLRIL